MKLKMTEFYMDHLTFRYSMLLFDAISCLLCLT